ncbi:MAG: hypothetical protein WC284_16555 [Candidimonas sp.]
MLIEDIRGQVVRKIKYDELYHLTDSHGFSYSVSQNSLESIEGHISVTFNPNINFIFGRDYYDFKYILDGHTIAADYGVYRYVFHTTEVGSKGERQVALSEDEYRINSRILKPLQKYLSGIILLFPVLSEKCIKWLSEHHGNGYLFRKLTPSSPSIMALYDVMIKWKKPIYVLEGGKKRKLNKIEISFLSDILRMVKDNMYYFDILDELIEKYDIIDFSKKPINRKIMNRRKIQSQFVRELNSFYNRHYVEIDKQEIQDFIFSWIDKFKLSGNESTFLKSALLDGNMIDPSIPPVEWGIIFRGIVNDEPIDEIVDVIPYLVNRNRGIRKEIESFLQTGEPSWMSHQKHTGTMMSGGDTRISH